MKTMAAAVTMAAALTACSGGTVYDRYKHVTEWERADTASFVVPAMTAGGAYSTDVGLRINANYPFKGICLIVDRRVLPADIVLSDTIDCLLIDNNGRATGRGLSNYQYLFHVDNMKLNQGDSLIVTVRHNMKRETLPGIEDIGLKVTRE